MSIYILVYKKLAFVPEKPGAGIEADGLFIEGASVAIGRMAAEAFLRSQGAPPGTASKPARITMKNSKENSIVQRFKVIEFPRTEN
jgi:hypothetical protein